MSSSTSRTGTCHSTSRLGTDQESIRGGVKVLTLLDCTAEWFPARSSLATLHMLVLGTLFMSRTGTCHSTSWQGTDPESIRGGVTVLTLPDCTAGWFPARSSLATLAA
ncbi:hypothetical protein J6590_030603 [Homalodisca vitripennis]|nr:hypothetical protein J6590_030603 [Homalodisca vitripennis]